MKYIFFIVLLSACSPEPEFIKDGKAYYTTTTCVESHDEKQWTYGYGLSYRMKYEWNWGWHKVKCCDVYRTDTIEIKGWKK